MTDRKAFPLRLDPALHDAVQRLADAELRSVNAEIEVLLREALARRGIKVARAEPARRGRPPATSTPGTTP
ncbi:MAG: Arc family DNA-binding protein [Erythrobacter sp.]